MDPRGKAALVTGGGSGIGRATAIALAQAGAGVLVADLDAEAAERTAREIGVLSGRASSARVDVRERALVRELFAEVEARFGGLDILVNNAGVATAPPRFPDGGEAGWERTLATNLWAVVIAIELAVPMMRRRGGGVVVSTASDAGLAPYANDPVYAASKHGVVGLTRSLAFLAAEGVRVNCVCPGPVDTPMVERGMDAAGLADRAKRALLRRMLRPDEVAAAILGLVRDDAMAGQALLLVRGQAPRTIAPPLDATSA